MNSIKTPENNTNKPNDLFFEMFENSSVEMIIMELETEKFLFVNQSFTQFFGFEKIEIIGKKLTDVSVFSSDFRKQMLVQIDKKKGFNSVEIAFKNKAKEQFWFLVSLQIIQFQHKECALVSFNNISKSKKKGVRIGNCK